MGSWERLTLTIPLLRRERTVVWFVTGPAKAEAVRDLVGHADIPATRIGRDDAIVLADEEAASLIEHGP